MQIENKARTLVSLSAVVIVLNVGLAFNQALGNHILPHLAMSITGLLLLLGANLAFPTDGTITSSMKRLRIVSRIFLAVAVCSIALPIAYVVQVPIALGAIVMAFIADNSNPDVS